ncbi:hypothetical protein LJR220_003377 [Bradyrhizobium sp. LjRoot220]|uniref:hypothetical protein n=1 Tax=Bradyrhizobium sp. LjRoot220 TaxID=3342284 RepID=UPI003ECF2F58
MAEIAQPPTIAEMAVALSLAHSKLQLDLAQTEVIARRIGLSKMGLDLVIEGLQRDVACVEHALEMLKQMVEIEPQVRALIARKKTGRWSLASLTKVAVL